MLRHITTWFSRLKKQANIFYYSPLGNEVGKQIKTIEDQGIKQVKTLKSLKSGGNKQDIKSVDEMFQKELRTNEIENKTDEIKK